MEITISWPDHLELCGLEQTGPRWRAYIRVPNQFYLQGALASSPQAAVDLAVALVTRNYRPPVVLPDDLLSDL